MDAWYMNETTMKVHVILSIRNKYWRLKLRQHIYWPYFVVYLDSNTESDEFVRFQGLFIFEIRLA